MEFPGQARTFAHSLLQTETELSRNLVKAVSVSGYQQENHDAHVYNREPPGFPPWRQDFNSQRSARLAPGTPAGSTLHTERVRAPGQCGIAGESLVTAYLVPLVIQPLEFVSIAVGCRVGIAESREFYGEDILCVRGGDSIGE